MHIPLEGLAGEAQREFFDHLVAALRRVGGHTGSSGFNSDGSFEVSLECSLPIGDSAVCLLWQWVRNPDGTVDTLTVVPAHADCAKLEWEEASRELVTRVFVAALQRKRTDFFVRSTYHYVGPNLDGEYWLPGFRFAPAICDDAHPFLINCERAVYIDQNVAGIDAAQAFELGDERAKRIAARISLLLNVGLYQSQPDMRFVLGAEDASTAAPGRLHLGFIPPHPQPSRMPAKGQECSAGQFLPVNADPVRRPDDKLKLPADTRSIIRATNDPAHLFGEAFDACARLYQVSLVAGRYFGTVRLAYQVAAVEAITQSMREYSSFADFVRSFAPAAHDLEPLINYLYGSVRSAHFHAGAFPLGDFKAFGFDLTNADRWQAHTLSYDAQHMIRGAILSWVRQTSAAIDPHRRRHPA